MKFSFGSLCAGTALVAAIMVHPARINRDNLIRISVVDDTSYLAHATAIAFNRFPNYTRELTLAYPGNYALGPGLFSVPLVWLFLEVDRLCSDTPIYNLNDTQIATGWTPFGLVITTELAFVIGMFFGWRACGGRDSPNAALAVFLTAVSSGLPVYVFDIPSNSHAYEFATVAFLFWVFTRARTYALRAGLRLTVTVVLGAIAVYLCRYNDIVFSALIGTAAFYVARHNGRDRRWILDAAILAVLLALAVGVSHRIIIYGAQLTNQRFWMPDHLNQYVFKWFGVGHYLERLGWMLFAPDWGMVYLDPLLLLGFVLLLRRLKPARVAILLALPVASNFALSMSWLTQGAMYGYRYVVYGMAPLAAWGLARWMDDPAAWRHRRAAVIGLSVFPTIAMLGFGNHPDLGLEQVTSAMVIDWSNPTYVPKVLRMIVHPVELIQAVFASGVPALFTTPMLRASTCVKWLVIIFLPLISWAVFPESSDEKEPATPADKNS